MAQAAETVGAKRRTRAAKEAPMTRDQLLQAYRDMLLIRRFEERAGQLYGMGLIGGFCHLYIGQEAVVVGMQAALEEGDQVITSYRDHGHMLACGMDPQGRHGRADRPRAAAIRSGKGGSMHMFSREKNFFGGHGIVGAQVPHRHRPGLRQPLPRERQVCADLFRRRRDQPGPGLRELQHGRAVEAAGRLHHREQPVRHGHLRRARLGRAPTCSKRGVAFGIPGEQVDGMDVVAVNEAGERAAAEHCRAGAGARSSSR